MKKFRDGFVGPILILFAICLVITFAVAAANEVTAPLIAQIMAEKADRVRIEVLPGGDSFTQLPLDGMPEGVTEAHAADNGAGYVFKSQARGFDGQVVWMVGIDTDGNITGINMFDHTETAGQGTLVGEDEYLENYYGHNNVDGVDAVTNATRTSESLKAALHQALEAYELVS